MPGPKWFAHANVNAVDVHESERFYTECFGFTPEFRTAPTETQDGSGFGMAGVQVRWEGVLLSDHRGARGPLVDLLQWKEPPTEGRAAEGRSDLGINAYVFVVADLDEVVTKLRAFGSPVEEATDSSETENAERVVITQDPSGTRVEAHAGAPAITYAGVRINCRDLARSIPFYVTSLFVDRDEVVSVTRTGDGAGRFDVCRMYLPGQRDRFSIHLTRWTDPAPTGTPPTAGNQPGLYRLALSVEDIQGCWQQLLDVLPSAEPPVTVALGSDLPDVEASFFPDPDGATLEYLEQHR